MILTAEILDRAAQCPRAAAFLAAGKVPAEETVSEWMNRVFRETRNVLLDAAQMILVEGSPIERDFCDEMAHRGAVELRRHFKDGAMVPRPGGSVRNLSGRGVERDSGTAHSVLLSMVEELIMQVRTLVERHGSAVKFGGPFKFRHASGGEILEFAGTIHAFAEDTMDLYFFEPIGRDGNERLIVEGFGLVLTAGFFDCHSVHGIGILRTLQGGMHKASRTITDAEMMTARASALWYRDAMDYNVRSSQCHTAFGPCPYQGACRGDNSNSGGHLPVKLIDT